MSWQRWKHAEKLAARIINGLRRWRVSYSESIGDIVHPEMSIEVKYGSQVPKCLRVKKPTFMGGYYLVPSSNMNFPPVIGQARKKIVFLERAFKQAKSYDPRKIPIVAVKPTRYRGVIFICRICDREFLEENLRKAKHGTSRVDS